MLDIRLQIGDCTNFAFLGEAGSGKSEVALNFAAALHALVEREVHFFDMDMTKPLFRSRDVEETLRAQGIHVHYQQQFMDAPTVVGGVRPLLRDAQVFTVLDVGGDYIGARSVGGFAQELSGAQSMIFYVLNAFRPWSCDITHIDETLGKILGVSHIPLDRLHMIDNSNTGPTTDAEEFLAGSEKLRQLLTPYSAIEFSCVQQTLLQQVEGKATTPLFPLHRYLTYPWLL